MENLDIKNWAQQIRQMKINELKELIAYDQKTADSIITDNELACTVKNNYINSMELRKKKLKMIE